MLFLLRILHALIICVYFIILDSDVERGNRWFYYTMRVFPSFLLRNTFSLVQTAREVLRKPVDWILIIADRVMVF